MPQPGYPIGRTWKHAILLRILHPVLVPFTIMLGKNNKLVFRLDLNTCGNFPETYGEALKALRNNSIKTLRNSLKALRTGM